MEEAVREAGERCKPTFIAGKNLVEHQEQLQGWAGNWLSVKTERCAGSMQHFRTGSSNSEFQLRRSGSVDQRRNGERAAGACGGHQALVSQRLDRARQQAVQPLDHGRGSNHRQETVRKLAHQAG